MDTPRLVLVVDDDSGIRDTMRDILLLEGYAVHSAGDGESAIDCCQANHYDMVLLDIRMPGIDGVETLRGIKTVDPEARVIMITGFDVGERVQEAMAQGAEAVFRKPFDVADFMPLLLATTV